MCALNQIEILRMDYFNLGELLHIYLRVRCNMQMEMLYMINIKCSHFQFDM